MDKLRFGTAGVPISTKDHNTLDGIKQVRALDLECMELEFVRNVNISSEKAPELKKIAQHENVALTCHGQYFVNLNGKNKSVTEESKKRMLHASEMAYECGAGSVAFHLGYYLGMEKESVYEIIKKQVTEVANTLIQQGIKIDLRGETTGKGTQFGDFNELLKLSSEIENFWPCIDFAHHHARYNGKNNSYDEFADVLAKVEKVLGNEALKNMHIHIAGIAYSEKGERNHLNLKDSDMNYKALIKTFKDFKINGCVICESPNIEEDAQLLKKEYELC